MDGTDIGTLSTFDKIIYIIGRALWAIFKYFKYPIIGLVYYVRQIMIVLKYAILGLVDCGMYVNNRIIYPVYTVISRYIAKNVEAYNKYVKKQKELAEKKRLSSEAAIKRQKDLERERQILIESLKQKDAVNSTGKEITFRYKARNAEGKIVTGTIKSLTKMDVMSFLVNEQYTVYKIETSKFIEFLYGSSSLFEHKMSTKDLIFWLTQLSTYVKAGIPLAEAVSVLGKQMGKKGSRKQLFDALTYELTMGNSFSVALEKQHGVFPSLLINMLKAAEATGELEETLDDMSDYYTAIDSNRKEMISAMTYPILISLFALAVVVFIILYVVPQFTGIYSSIGATVNPLTQFIIDISEFLQANIIMIILFVILGVFVFYLLYKFIKEFRRTVQYILMHIPVVKNIIIYNELAVFTKTFASLLKNNVYITESMDILTKITTNEIYKTIMYDTITNISRGDKISLSFQNNWAVPDVAYYMIVTGESTGELPEMLNKVSIYFSEEHKNMVTSLKAFIEPIMIISLALIVGVIVISVIIPMFQMYGQLS